MRLAPARVQAAADRRADALAASGDQHDPALHAALPDYTLDLVESNTPIAMPHPAGFARRAFRSTVTDLPEPGADARAHSERVAAHIRAAIAADAAPIPFSRYMELALYAPGLGYYAAGAQKLGAGGDFITAPGNDSAVRDGARDAGGGRSSR